MEPDDSQRKIDDLLVQWELARESGEEPSVHTLCKDCPELADQLAERIEKLSASSWMLVDMASDDFASVHRVTVDEHKTELSAEAFLNAVVTSGVLSDQQLDALQSPQDIDESSDASSIADDLIDQGLLTEYQAEVILRGSKSPLVMDRYIVVDALGAGGMGLVFKAIHRRMHREVSLKILPSVALDSEEKLERFRREVKAAAKLSHPNVVTAHDAYEKDGSCVLIMEFVDGENLQEMVAEHGVLSPNEAMEIIDQVAAGLNAAHQLGMIHRDVKPSNIMLSTDGTPKLLDLGLARMVQGFDEDDSDEITDVGLAMGTAAYKK